MTSPRQKFQELLRKLFQFDSAELDFGIYRIMNHKRAVIEKFIDQDLLDAVTAELAAGALAQQSTLADELAETIEQIKDKLGSEALDPEGNLDPTYKKTPLGKQYVKLQAAAAGTKNRPELEAEIFNHLYTFFSRYYDEGDFLSLRRYSKREKYAIPYNGEEVFLHWASRDQYYIKTGEHFTDYSYRHGNWTVRFKLRNADVEQNNVKGAKRFFVPQTHSLTVDDERQNIIIPFEFRPIAADEEKRFGKTKTQEAILKQAVVSGIEAVGSNADALSALAHEKRQDGDANPVTELEHHLRVYTSKNSTDFFIHKDLRGVLLRELDFYLKNEVINLDELEAAGKARSEDWFQLMRTIKNIGSRIVGFVSQIENFQKRLFEKKKFIIETNYCVTLDKVPKKLYSEIVANDAQREEWIGLFAIDKTPHDLTTPRYSNPLSLEFLRANPSLVVDTRFYDEAFRDALLSSMNDIHSQTNGLLIHADSFSALDILQTTYRKAISCVSIDPPYNTGNDDFIYRDTYQHSSWLSMMADRLENAKRLCADGSAIFITIDDNEHTNLEALATLVIGEHRYRTTIVWQKKDTPANDATGLSVTHDYLLVVPVDDFFKRGLIPRTEEQSALYKNPDNDPRGPWTRTALVVKGFVAGNDFPMINPAGKEVRPPAGTGWSMSRERLQELIDDNRIWWGKDGTGTPFRKKFLSEVEEGIVPVTWWDYRFAGTNRNARAELRELFPGEPPFDTPKPTSLIRRVLEISKASAVLDYFAGSGTTGHAVIDLNREDGGNRKFILVEMGDHFDTVLKPRIEKVIYSKDWKEGEPISRIGSSQAFKYMSLESYEDALDNISFQQGNPHLLKMDDYVLDYMLDFETKDCATLLNVARLDSPFDYKLYCHGEDEPLQVDLPETFNYLIGLHVKTRKVYGNKGVRYLVYQGRSDERETIVIWRTTRGWGQKEFDADRAFVVKQKIVNGAEDVLVNTDSFIPGARSLDPVFKRRMFNEE